MNFLPEVCCVIVTDEKSNLLLIKRGQLPDKGKWSLISGIGYKKKGHSLKQGVTDEVVGDVAAVPFNINELFSLKDDSQDIVVFEAEVNRVDVVSILPHVTEIKWCEPKYTPELFDLAFTHTDILKKYLDTLNLKSIN